MKFSKIFVLLIITLIAPYTSAQMCPGRVHLTSCTQPANVGHSGPRCPQSIMWYYHAGTRQCHRMLYRGCGGNWNRFCTIGACLRICRNW
ncbi:kunitz-like peptide PcKuz1 [Lucilia cuprina]|uniref:kunitz-like peptide PcKuz1 n=1 Tax=Lucilia cuprina TaxID=7375 RepID=UPI001F06192B|nr:kunitz-like peptide PcKuz1 [Lucilia cuprina]XP_046812080.1 kunitz-like peptide PcKuz1 [Lucilia cuprina]